jgi:hypothetical protein
MFDNLDFYIEAINNVVLNVTCLVEQIYFNRLGCLGIFTVNGMQLEDSMS